MKDEERSAYCGSLGGCALKSDTCTALRFALSGTCAGARSPSASPALCAGHDEAGAVQVRVKSEGRETRREGRDAIMLRAAGAPAGAYRFGRRRHQRRAGGCGRGRSRD